jgi:aryl-alcohol dehydrogenase-like predicted oxidoreductase
LEKRRLGNADIRVAPLMFGGNVFGWTLDERQSFEMLDAFVGAGFDFIDTADVYSRFVPGNAGGESETILGNWIKARGNRERIVLATKAGMDMGEGRQGLSKAWLVRAAEDSLRRLQTDYIDLYQAHMDDAGTPLEETLEAFADLIRAGKVRAIGASNYGAARLAEALATSDRLGLPRYQSLQPLYNLTDRAAYEAELRPLCEREGLGVLPYFSLASGFLTGKYRSADDLAGSARGEIVKQYLNERGLRILAALDRVAADHAASPARVALAWLIAQPTVTAPIASATSPAQLEELARATELKLDAAALALLDAASAA